MIFKENDIIFEVPSLTITITSSAVKLEAPTSFLILFYVTLQLTKLISIQAAIFICESQFSLK
jgi:hypothetical protein